ncbi:MAG: ParA family protein [Bacillota bacterium]|nr:ParA family protein [Bacillota bacterium]
MTRVIAIANQKGGVGKTTTAINLSAALGHFGKKVLLADMDPQGNAGRGLGLDINIQDHTIFEALNGKLRANQCISTTKYEGIDILPANLRLAQFETSQRVESSPFSSLKRVFSELPGNHYDYIIIDCPPSLGALCLNSLVASDSVIIPVQCEYFAMEAVAAIVSTITKVHHDMNQKLRIEGFLLTMYDARTTLGTEVASQVRGTFKESTFLTAVPRNQSVSESQGHQMPVTVFRPSSQGASAYFALAREVMDHEEK